MEARYRARASAERMRSRDRPLIPLAHAQRAHCARVRKDDSFVTQHLCQCKIFLYTENIDTDDYHLRNFSIFCL